MAHSNPSFWQGCAGHWQPLFIREHWLPLGHAAWQGYRIQGRGLVDCTVSPGNLHGWDWQRETWPYTLRYVPLAQGRDYLAAQSLSPDQMKALLTCLQTYRPEADLLLALGQGGPVSITLLQNLAIAPPDCYRQFCDRQAEFFLAPPFSPDLNHYP